MAIVKNEIPILEFDTEQTALINPAHEKFDLKLPKKCVFAFLGEYISEYVGIPILKFCPTIEARNYLC